MHCFPAALLLLITNSAFLVAAAQPKASTTEASRPNLVFIYTDDQRYDALGVVQREQGDRARFPWFQTPHLDRLAAEGVRFRNAFVINSLCSPSRAAFLTGRYNHLNGIANNHTPFPVDSVTHASLLRAAGYTTGYIGKFHMGPLSGKRPGFDYSASFVGQGRYFDCPFEIDGVKTETSGWVDDVSTEYAIDFIKRSQRKTFLLVVGYKSSHGPWEPPDRAKDRFAGEIARPPVNATSIPPYIQREPAERKNINQFPTPADSARAEMHRQYFRTLSAIDENVGRLLKTLDDVKLTDNTVVVYTSDNGFYLGEHGLGDKRSAYEESILIPFLVRYPKLAPKGRVVDPMILNVDLAPTFLDLAGLPVPKEMQGRSWKPLLTGQPVDWRKAFFYEYFLEASMGPPTLLAVRTETAKLIKYPGHEDWTELYDLKSDPHEMRNLINDPRHRDLRQAMEAEFEKQAKLVDFRIPDYADKPGDPPAKKARKRAGSAVAPNTFVLRFDLAKLDGTDVPDASGLGNLGMAKGVRRADGRNGTKAAAFDGNARIDVANSDSLDPSGRPWTFEAVINAEKPDGVILARGGATQGYALHLIDGKPAATVTIENLPTTVTGSQVITGKWIHLAGVIDAQRHLKFFVDGGLVGEKNLRSFISNDPNDAMNIGTDAGSQVTKYPQGAGFTGLIESVSIFSGERDPARLNPKSEVAP